MSCPEGPLPASGEALLLDGRYLVARELRRGPTGIVYLAEDRPHHRRVALKVLHARLERDATTIERLTRESRHLGGLRHPNLVAVHGMGVDPAGRCYVVLDYVAGELLSHRVARLTARGERLSVREIIRLVAGVASGLGAAHAAGIVHGALSPACILVCADDGRPAVFDFDALDRTPASHQAHLIDVYALGALTYELLTGERPEPSPQAPSLRRPEVPRPLDRLIQRALADDPAARPASCGELTLGLQACLDATLRATPTVHPPPESPVVVVTPNRHFAARCADVLVRELARLDVTCEHALDGEDAWTLCRDRVPRLLVCELDLAALGALELVERLRQHPATAAVPVCLITARPVSSEERAELARLGVRQILTTPFPDARLAAIASEAMGAR